MNLVHSLSKLEVADQTPRLCSHRQNEERLLTEIGTTLRNSKR